MEIAEKTFIWGGGPRHGKLTKPGHQKAPEKSLAIKDQSSPMLRIVPQSNEVVDITRREGKLNLIPWNAAGAATPMGIPVCNWSTRKTEG